MTNTPVKISYNDSYNDLLRIIADKDKIIQFNHTWKHN